MPTLTLDWKPEYCLGDPLIDAQHERLFALANVVLQTKDLPGIMKAILQLSEYTRVHFSAEEALMRERNYAHIEEHHALHEHLLQKLSMASSPVAADRNGFHVAVHSLMKDWILQHILNEDLKIPHTK
jgi:hemerythrin